MATPSSRQLVAGYVPVVAVMLALTAVVVAVDSPGQRPSEVATDGDGFTFDDPAAATTGGAGDLTGDGTDPASGIGASGSQPGTGSGGAGTGGEQPGGDPGAPAGGAPGAGASGSTAAADCSRNEIFRAPTCRPSAFSGDNGGQTAPGVTNDEVRIVVYIPKRNEQTTAILAAAGYASTAHRIDALEAYEAAFNEHFETYGRRIRLIFQQGPNDATDAQGQIADAQSAARDSNAFAVVTSSASDAFYDELARLKRPFFQRLDLYDSNWFAARAPYAWASAADSDVVLGHVAEYWCKRLGSGKAAHAGDAATRTKNRKLGIIYLDRFNWGRDLKAKIEACGSRVEGPVMSYNSDVSTANQQATAIASQMSAEGVTTVACACDAIAMTFFTTAATNQVWFPEWLITGIGDTDQASNARAYDPAQARSAFGVSFSDYYVPLATRDYYRAYFEGKPRGDREAALRAGPAYYDQLLYVISAIEAAGPNLTPRTFASALGNMPPRTSQQKLATTSFGRNGPGPFSAVDDLMEIWWDPANTGPDGDPGRFFYVSGGRRHSLGGWPTSAPNVFNDDGSPQPARDPDA